MARFGRNPSRWAGTAGAVLALSLLALGLAAGGGPVVTRSAAGSVPSLPNPILFVTQFPIPADFTTIGSVFGNHRARISTVGRGGDLWIVYPSGTLRNLTAEAGYGEVGFQGAGAIAVRDPAVYWDGAKAVFSMVVGAPTEQYEVTNERWQLYEITGLGEAEAAVITKVPNQPEAFNNVSPAYGTDDRILYISDRPRNGAAHLYPQLDEYESAVSNSGLWSLDPATGDLKLLDHSPSGDFTPIVDSLGRVIFSRWDHLQRDQQADADADGDVFGTFNYSDESAEADRLDERDEVFPEPRGSRVDLLEGTNLEGHRFNHFFPWMVNEDGSELETLNHIGRHELHDYFNRSLNDDPNLIEFIASVSGRFNPNPIDNFLHVREDLSMAGRYVGIDAPEFQTHSAGQVIVMEAGELPADETAVIYGTPRSTQSVTPEGGSPPADHSGFYRNPLPLSNGQLVAIHTPETRADQNEGSRAAPVSRYDFRLKSLSHDGTHWQPGTPLTPGIVETISYWDPDVLVQFSGELWELSPVEVVARTRPESRQAELPAPEASIFAEEDVAPADLRRYLEDHDLALIVSRDVTSRDVADRQQPFNLAVPGGVQTHGAGGLVYEVSHLQLFQGDQVRGIGGIDSPRPGRRVLAQPMHDALASNPPAVGGPAGSVELAVDGSLAAMVPARRALSWQLVDPAGVPVVRERYWLTFQPGEIRVCASCHGLNSEDQAAEGEPANPPEALRTLLRHWKQSTSDIFADGFESGDLGRWSTVAEFRSPGRLFPREPHR